MAPQKGVGKRVCDLFFTRDSTNSNVFMCQCGTKRKRSGTSYSNMLSHVQSSHADAYQRVLTGERVSQSQLDGYFSTTKSGHLYGWLDFIINGLLPFSFVEKRLIRKHVKHDPPSLNTFMKYLGLLTKLVERKVSDLLPDNIALVFDGWTADSTHYLAVFATFPLCDGEGFGTRLLTISPMGDETSLATNEHFEFLSYILGVYGKSWSNVSCLVGDNVNCNKSLANKAKIPFIGCASHRFNLAMRVVLNDDEELISKINTIMVKLRGLLLGAKLRRLTSIRPKIRNTTRWSSTHDMIVRYVRIREFLPNLESEEIDSLFLSPSENRRVDAFLQQLSPLESVTKMLQREETTVSDTRALFDAVINSFPGTINKLSSTADIVHCAAFESAIVNIQRGNAAALSRDESEAIRGLRIEEGSDEETGDEGLSFAERALKKQKCVDVEKRDKYIDTRFLVPTSNICERLFSRVGYALSQRRRGICPANLESQMFLHLNCDLWGKSEVNQLTFL
eukprot:IDg3101t1